MTAKTVHTTAYDQAGAGLHAAVRGGNAFRFALAPDADGGFTVRMAVAPDGRLHAPGSPAAAYPVPQFAAARRRAGRVR